MLIISRESRAIIIGQSTTTHAGETTTFRVRADSGSYNTQNSSTWNQQLLT